MFNFPSKDVRVLGQWAFNLLKPPVKDIKTISRALPKATPFEAYKKIAYEVPKRTGEFFFNKLRQPVETGYKKTTDYFKPTEDVRFRDVVRELPETGEKIAKFTTTMREEMSKSGGSLGLSLMNIFNDLQGKKRVSEFKPREDASKIEKGIHQFVFGKEPVKSIERRIFEGEKTAKKIGEEYGIKSMEKYPLAFSAVGVGAIISLDFTGFGGGKKEAVKLIAKMDDVADISRLLRQAGVAEDLVLPTAKKMKTIKSEVQILNALDKIEVLQKSTKIKPIKQSDKYLETMRRPKVDDFQSRVIAGQDLGKEIGKKVNPDGTLTLYHGTSKQNASDILKGGRFNEGAYFSVKKTGTEFGDSPLDVAKRKFGKDATVMEIKVDARTLESAAAGSEVFSPKALFKEDGIWKATKPTFPKVPKPDPLITEARKYAEAGDNKYYYVRNIDNKGGYINGKPSLEGTGRFNQQYEPTGEYMNIVSKRGYDNALPNLKKGTVEFKNPLVIETDLSPNWKKELSNKYGGLKRDKLSQAINEDGYDGIITMVKSGSGKLYPSEVVDLKVLKFFKKPDPLITEARKYKSAEEFVKSKDVLKKAGVLTDNRGNPIKVYHGSPYKFDEIKTAEELKISSIQEGGEKVISFTTDKKIAQSYADVMPREFTIEKIKLMKRYDIDEITRKKQLIESYKNKRNIKEVEKEFNLYKKLVDEDWNKNKEFLYNNNYKLFRSKNKNLFDRIETLQNEYKAIKNKPDIILSKKEQQIYNKYNNELNKLVSKYSKEEGQVYEAYLRVKNPLEMTGEEVGTGTLRANYLADIGSGEYDAVIIKNADTGRGFADEYFVKDSSQIITKSQLTDIYNKAQTKIKPVVKSKAEEGVKVPVKKGVKTPERNLPAVIRGETFTLGTTTPTTKRAFAVKALKKEISNAKIAREKAERLTARKQKIREDAIENINMEHGHTDRIIEKLKKKNLSQEDIDNIVLEDGTKLVDTVKIKREKNGVLSATITKDTLDEIKKDFTLDTITQKWIPVKTAMQKIKEAKRGAKEVAIEYYELPQIFFDRTGLRKYFYDPIRTAERNAQDMKTGIFKQFDKAGLMKKGGWFTADRFKLSSKEAEDVGRYYLARQEKGGTKKLSELSEQGKKFVELFDDVIKQTEERFYEVAKLNGKNPGKVKDYAPIMTGEDYKLAQEIGDMDFIFRKHPAFFSTKQRVEDVPFKLYELDYRKIAGRWIDQISNFNHLGEVGTEVKYLSNSDEFKKLVGERVWKTTNKWLQNKFNPQVLSSAEKGARFARQKTAIASLGLNFASVTKQVLTQVPLTIIEKAPPKLSSKFAKNFGIKVSDLPSIKERRGNVAIMDMQEGINKAFVGPLSEFDKTNAQKSLNALLDKNYNKFLKEGKEVSPEIQAQIIKSSQDTLDMWYGGMTSAQLPKAFRTEAGKLLNMFIYPLTSQLNGFVYSVAKAKGINKAEKFAEVMASALTIAYLEQVITNLSPEWSDEKEMAEDILSSLAGNIPILSQIVFAFKSDQPLAPSAAISGVSRFISQTSKSMKDQADAGDVAFAFAEMFGLPKAIRRAVDGSEIVKEGGLRDENGKMLAPIKGSPEYIRAFLRGKYGTIATKDWIRNIGEKKEDRRWFVPEVEFLQNGDYARKLEIYKQFDEETKKDLRNLLSEGQQDKLDNEMVKEVSSKVFDKIDKDTLNPRQIELLEKRLDEKIKEQMFPEKAVKSEIISRLKKKLRDKGLNSQQAEDLANDIYNKNLGN